VGVSSTIPAAIDGLVAGVTATVEAGVQVLDGPAVGQVLHTDHIIIGGSLDEDAATGEQVRAELGSLSRGESYDLLVQAGAYSGGGAQKEVRDRAYALMASVEAYVRSDPTLGGAVKDAQVGGAESLDQRPPTDLNDADVEVVLGRKAVVTFRVSCLGWIT